VRPSFDRGFFGISFFFGKKQGPSPLFRVKKKKKKKKNDDNMLSHLIPAYASRRRKIHPLFRGSTAKVNHILGCYQLNKRPHRTERVIADAI
jgi:hypothetical protein